LFLLACGIKPDGLRFRQHLKNEMAHYASDCWDAEVKNSYGWTEVVGHADRSCYDLECHTRCSNDQLTAYERFSEPKLVTVADMALNKGLMGKTFKAANKAIEKYLTGLNNEEKLSLRDELAKGPAEIKVGGQTYKLDPGMVTITQKEEKQAGRNIVPHVIEPSFGVGRILYCILEHSYWVREGDEQRGVLSLAPRIAPVKCSILPLISDERLEALIPNIQSSLSSVGISSKVDSTGQAIGRRYARTDEIGIPFGITIDFDTLTDGTVTLRERDTTVQVRVKMEEVPRIITDLVEVRRTWQQIMDSYPRHVAKEKEEETKKDG
jgi:glycyl-tRNA synthetase